VNWNLTFTFEIADLPGSSKSVDLTLPYAAFDQKLSYPFPNLDPSLGSGNFSYFPLRKAANNTQYTIGRSFLQETYLIVDYERQNFSVSQAKFAIDAVTNLSLVAITSPQASQYAQPKPSLSTGAKVGIGVGGALLAILIFVSIILWLRKRRHPKPSENEEPAEEPLTISKPWEPPSELAADKQHAVEAPADASATRHELPGSDPVELQGSEVAISFYGPDATKYNREHNFSATDPVTRKLTGGELASAELEGQGPPPYPQVRRNNTVHSEQDSVSSAVISPVVLPSSADGRHSMAMSSPATSAVDADGRPRSIPGSSRRISQSPTRQLAVPQSPRSQLSSSSAGPASRADSRSSRFVEEGLHDTPGTQHPPEDTTVSQPRRKFSWEK
jgi:hypothetical protein